MGPGASYKGTWSYQGRGWDRPKKQSYGRDSGEEKPIRKGQRGREAHTEGTVGKRSPYGRDSGEEKPVKETERQQLERQEENQARRRKC